MNSRSETALYLVTFILILSFIGWLAYNSITLGDTSEDYEIVCIDGHEYHRANFGAKGFLAIKLTDSGLPIKCKSED